MADLNLRPERHSNCFQPGVSIIASRLLRLPIQMDAPNSRSRPASPCLWTTLARTVRSLSKNVKEACHRKTPDRDNGFPLHRSYLDDPQFYLHFTPFVQTSKHLYRNVATQELLGSRGVSIITAKQDDSHNKLSKLECESKL